MRIHHKSRRLFSTCLISAVVAVVATVLFANYRPPTPSATALSGSEFQPGRIIDDAVFYNKSAMTAQQIQTFLNQKVPICDTNGTKIYSGTKTRAQSGTERGNPPPFICLKDYRQDRPEKIANNYCGYLPELKDQTAAQLIHAVSQACNVNPQVLLVLLQKEQSLVTDDWPFQIQYRSATGYGCPDTAPCDAQYYGFFNQIYRAAWQYQVYRANPNNYNYRAGRNNYIQYNPSASCGGQTVYIENQATAGLYIYTPYVPNKKALDNLYGTGDSCSAYGNRNFWRLFNDWFGNPQALIDVEKATSQIQSRYAKLGGETGVLGQQITEITFEYKTDGRAWVEYQNGVIVWRKETGAWESVNGPIRDRWAQLGGSAGIMGSPAGGIETRLGQDSQKYQRGTIYHTPTKGSWYTLF
ncbi:MAG: hypothetical protein LBQ11_00845 [Candidatus Nomurabacteria bacterium]|jgi:hypothetical protein|nr:hypothetical protein [Candidatus Nomurabacteria bacterium]